MDMDMNMGVDDKAKIDGVGDPVKSVKSPLNTQPFVGNVGKDKISVNRVNSKQVKRRVGEKAHCTFCGSEGIIVEKYSKR